MADVNETLNKLNDTKDFTEEYEQEDIQNNKVMGILAYLGILVLIPIFAAKDSKFARFHANQGLVLAIAGIALSIIGGVLSWIPIGNIIAGIVCGLAGLVLFILMILGIVNVVNGRAKELPIVGKIRILK